MAAINQSNNNKATPTQTPGLPATGKRGGAIPLLDNLSPLQKSVKFGYARGAFSCDNFRHYHLVHPTGQEFSCAERRGWKEIIFSMVPYENWTCSCEREALVVASKNNRQGTLQNAWVYPGAQCVGIGKMVPGRPAKRVYTVNHQLTPAVEAELEIEYPHSLFVSLSQEDHEHPFSHTSNKMAGINTQNGLRKGTVEKPWRVLDLWGNPGANEQFNARENRVVIDTNCFAWTAKDFGRKWQKWGAVFDGARRRYYDCDLRTLEGGDVAIPDAPTLTDYDEIISSHSLYNNTPDETCRLVNLAKVPITAIMHKFSGPEGTLNMGELAYSKYELKGRKMVRQVTIGSDIDYCHPDNSWIFESTIWAHSSSDSAEMIPGEKRMHTDSKCMSWDIQRAGRDTWKITFYAIPASCYNAELDAGKKTTLGCVVAVPAATTKKSSKNKKKSAAIKENGEVEVAFGRNHVLFEVPECAAEDFELARVKISNTPRTPSRFRDHNNWCKMTVKAILADKTKDFTADHISDFVHGSFWCDYVEDINTATADGLQKFHDSIKGDKVYTSGECGSITTSFDMILEAITVGLAAKNSKEAATKGIQLARSFFKIKH